MTIYDGSDMDVDCSIEAQNVGRQCKISVTLDKDVSGPLNVYYELRNFYQNQRSYVASLSISQLQGSIESQSTLDTDCQYKVTNGTLLLNPCGLIANSFFTGKCDFIKQNSWMRFAVFLFLKKNLNFEIRVVCRYYHIGQHRLDHERNKHCLVIRQGAQI